MQHKWAETAVCTEAGSSDPRVSIHAPRIGSIGAGIAQQPETELYNKYNQRTAKRTGEPVGWKNIEREVEDAILSAGYAK
jgi:hypothetical protein